MIYNSYTPNKNIMRWSGEIMKQLAFRSLPPFIHITSVYELPRRQSASLLIRSAKTTDESEDETLVPVRHIFPSCIAWWSDVHPWVSGSTSTSASDPGPAARVRTCVPSMAKRSKAKATAGCHGPRPDAALRSGRSGPQVRSPIRRDEARGTRCGRAGEAQDATAPRRHRPRWGDVSRRGWRAQVAGAPPWPA